MRIEERTTHNGDAHEVLQFIGAVTGHECFSLRDDFIEGLSKPGETPEEDIFLDLLGKREIRPLRRVKIGHCGILERSSA